MNLTVAMVRRRVIEDDNRRDGKDDSFHIEAIRGARWIVDAVLIVFILGVVAKAIAGWVS